VDGLGCGLDDQGIVPQFTVGKRGLLVSKESGFALGPTQTPLQYILGTLSRGVNAAGAWTWHCLPSSTKAVAWNNILAPQYLWIVCTGIYYLYLFSCVFCLMMVSIDQTILYQIVEWLVDSELERLWRKWSWTDLKYFAGICLEGLCSTTKLWQPECWLRFRLMSSNCCLLYQLGLSPLCH
jgi:hypothetical protein